MGLCNNHNESSRKRNEDQLVGDHHDFYVSRLMDRNSVPFMYRWPDNT